MLPAVGTERARPGHVLARLVFVLLVAFVTFEISAAGELGTTSRVELLVAGVLGMGLIVVLAVRFPGWLPAVVIVIVSLVPYQVSFVGKTPFGVVSLAGAVGLVAVVALFLAHGRAASGHLRGPEITAMMAWSALLFLSAALSADPKLSLNAARTIVVAMPLAYLAGRLIAHLDSRALGRIAVVAGGLSALAVLEEVTSFTPYSLVPSTGFPLDSPPEAVRGGLERVRLGYYHGSTLGTVLAVLLAVVVLHPRLGVRQRRWLLPLLAAGLFCTVTFQVWVAALIALLLLGIGLQRLRLGLAAVALVGGVVVGSGAIAPLNQLIENRIHPTGSSSDEYSFRLQLWPASVREADAGPVLGQGTGMFNLVEVTGTVRGQTVRLVDDNTFTSKLVETGWVGLFAMLGVLWLVALRMWHHTERWRAWAGLAALAAWFVMAMSVELLAGDQALLPAWLVLGMLSYRPTPDAAT